MWFLLYGMKHPLRNSLRFLVAVKTSQFKFIGVRRDVYFLIAPLVCWIGMQLLLAFS